MASIQGERASTGTPDSNAFQELVSQAVKKVLAGHEGADAGSISDNIVSRVVEELNPTINSVSGAVVQKEIRIPPPVAHPTPCVYNPTPIAELKKRHIPVVPYMPTRDSKVAVKRKPSPDGFKPWLSVPHDISTSLDHAAASAPTYSTVNVGEITYKPTAISSCGDSLFVQSYIPTIKSDSSSPNSYEDGNSNDHVSKTKEEYRPRSKKRREEYVPKKLKVPLKTVQQLDEPVIGQADMEGVTEIFDAEKEMTTGYNLEVEPKFSDDEEPVKTASDVTKEEEDKGGEKSLSCSKPSRSNDDRKSKDGSNGSKLEERRASATKERRKSKEKSEKDKSRKEKTSSSSNDQDKDLKEVDNSARSKDKDKHKHSSSSSSKDRHHSSSSNKDKSSRSSKERRDSKHSEKGSSRSKDSSRSSKEKDRDRKSEDRHKSSSNDKRKSKSSSSSSRDRHSSNKSDKKSGSRSTSGKSTSSSKKTEARKKSNDEASSAEDHDEKENSPSIRFRSASPFSEEILEISDSDHDIEEECLKIFQVRVAEVPHSSTFFILLLDYYFSTGVRGLRTPERSAGKRAAEA